MTQSHQKFIDAINAEHGEGVRLAEHVYADWLEEQCDPRSEAWRVLIQANRKPMLKIHEDLSLHLYSWLYSRSFGDCALEGFVSWDLWLRGDSFGLKALSYPRRSFFDAMNAAAIAYVRCHYDQDYGLTLSHVTCEEF